MKAFTIWQPWASLIAIGAKPYEFRRWQAPRSLIGQRIAIHAGSRKVRPADVRALRMELRSSSPNGTGLVTGTALLYLDRLYSAPGGAILSTVLCTAILGEPIKAAELWEGDSDRIDHHVWAWPLTEIEPVEPHPPVRGAQGFWEWRP